MTNFETEIKIDAPTGKIWQVLADIGTISRWNPGVVASCVYSTSVKIALFSAMAPWHAPSSHLAKSAVSGHAQYIRKSNQVVNFSDIGTAKFHKQPREHNTQQNRPNNNP